jgi:hypothetical protein
VIVEERDHGSRRRPCSAWAEYASRRISCARRGFRTRWRFVPHRAADRRPLRGAPHLRGPAPSALRAAGPRAKNRIEVFADALAAVRRQFWREQVCSCQRDSPRRGNYAPGSARAAPAHFAKPPERPESSCGPITGPARCWKVSRSCCAPARVGRACPRGWTAARA